MAVDPHDVTEDAVLGGRLRLRQPRRGHRFGHDGILLAAATDAEPGERVADFGAGVGVAGLALAARLSAVRVTLVERDPVLADLARQNIALNALAERADVLCADVRAVASSLGGSADGVIMNPPFNDPVRAQSSPDRARADAHVGSAGLLADWIAAAASLLRPGGRLTLIWRSERRGEALAALRGAFGDIRVRPVVAKPDAAPIRDLIRVERGASASIAVLPAFLLNGADGKPTDAAEAVMRQAAALRFD